MQLNFSRIQFAKNGFCINIFCVSFYMSYFVLNRYWMFLHNQLIVVYHWFFSSHLLLLLQLCALFELQTVWMCRSRKKNNNSVLSCLVYLVWACTCHNMFEHCPETWEICTVGELEYQRHRMYSLAPQLFINLGKVFQPIIPECDFCDSPPTAISYSLKCHTKQWKVEM